MKKILCTLITICTFAINSFAQSPTISSFSPTSGSIGTLVTITGTNLGNIDTVRIGGVAAIKISATSTTLVAMVMPGSNTGNIFISNISGSAISSSNFLKLNSIAPNTQQGNKLVGAGFIGASVQGCSVSISADGNTAIIGGSGDLSLTGAAWIFTRNGNIWTQQGNKLVGTGGVGNSQQGSSVSISADGNTAIIGGPRDNSLRGAFWIFTRTDTTWIQQGNKLVGTGFVGGAIYQGSSVSLSADGNTAIIGGYGDSSNRGASWIFTRTGNNWTQQGNKLVGTGSQGSTIYQGISVGLSADGNTAIFSGSADNSSMGASWIFNRTGNTWSQQGNKLVGTGSVGNSNQGRSVSLSADGNTAIVGGSADSSNRGASWIFTRIGNTWTQQGNKLVGTGFVGNSIQGRSVSISADGNIAIIGGPGDSSNRGTSWIFTRTGNSWTQQGNKLAGTNGLGNSLQATSVSLSADGNTAIIGGTADSSNRGASWIFGISYNANLSNMIISSTALNPAFNAAILDYTSSVNNSTTSITVTPTTADIYATMQIQVNGGGYISINSGTTSGSLSLNVGNNVIEVKVIDRNGTIKIYTTIITRISAPTISSFNPTSGSIGTLITVTGNNLNYLDTIKIGGVSAIKVSVAIDSIVVMVMPGTNTGKIYIANSSSNATSSINFNKINYFPPNTQQGDKLVGSGFLVVNSNNPLQGKSVSLSADGNTAIIGGTFDDYFRGASWIFTRTGNTWTQQGNKLVGTGGGGNQGSSVCISADGNTAIVGGNGASWIFTRTGNTWTQQGNKLVGTGGVGGNQNQGSSVSLSADGNTAIIGGYGDSSNMGYTGASWIFTRTGNTWTQQGNKLVGTGGAGSYIHQGYAVSLSADGKTAIVGGRSDSSNMGYTGASWIFTRTGNTWTQQGNKLVGTGGAGGFIFQGSAVSLSADGNTAIVGGPNDTNNLGNMGASWIFTRTGNTWTQQGNKLVGTSSSGGSQGISVSLSADGNTAIIGGSGDNSNIGASWIFTRTDTTWTQKGNKLVGTGGVNISRQGGSVSLSADGKTAIVGGFSDNFQIGAAWVFNGMPSISKISNMTGFISCQGFVSSNQSFIVSCVINNTDSLLITAPLGFEISTSNLSGFTNSLKLITVEGIINNRTIYVRLTSTATGTPSGNIVCSAPNAVSQNIAVSGIVTNLSATTSFTKNTICSANGTGTATILVTNGTAPYNYLWGPNANSQTTQTATGLKEDTYQVIAADSNNCSVTKSIKVLNTPNINTQVPITNIAMLDQSNVASFSQYYNYDLPLSINPNSNNPKNYADAGKYFRFKIQSKNSKLNGQSIVNGFCKVRSNSQYLTITDSIAALNNIAYNGKVWSADEFEVYINPTTPKGSNLYLDFVVEESATQFSTGCLSIPIAPLNYSSNTALTIDDDNNPDSHGNNNDTCELGETIEFYPWLNNVSNKNAQYVKGTLLNNNNFAGVNIWNNIKGINDTVMNNTWWNLAFGKPTSIDTGSIESKPAMDFVFDYSYGAPRNNFDLNLAVAAGFNLLSDTTLSLVQWSLPYNFKSEVGAADALQVNPQSLSYTSLTSSKKVAITSNRSWVVTSNQSWVNSKTTGIGNDSINITVAANTGLPRTALLTFTAGLITKILTINQDSFTTADILSLDKDSINTSFGASLNTVQVSSNRSWTVSSNQSWCGISTVTGSGNGSFNVINTINNTGLFRNALVTVTAGIITKNVYVGQSASVGINNPTINNQQTSLYPNPTEGKFSVGLNLYVDIDAKFEIRNALGQKVWMNNYRLQSGKQEIPVNLDLKAGLYFLAIYDQNNNLLSTKKLMISQ